jgi:cbb3-type cytochrome oxidase subunit 3
MITWWEDIIGIITLALISLALIFIVYSSTTKSTLSFRRVFYF